MKRILFAITVFFGNHFSAHGQYSTVQQGEGFYFFSNSIVNEILFEPSFRKPVAYFSESTSNSSDTSSKMPIPKVSWVVISNVTGFGFNRDYVIAISKSQTGTAYWIIDKTQEAEQKGLTKNEERMLLSNVKTINRKSFQRLQKQFNITVHNIQFYRNTDTRN